MLLMWEPLRGATKPIWARGRPTNSTRMNTKAGADTKRVMNFLLTNHGVDTRLIQLWKRTRKTPAAPLLPPGELHLYADRITKVTQPGFETMVKTFYADLFSEYIFADTYRTAPTTIKVDPATAKMFGGWGDGVYMNYASVPEVVVPIGR